MSDDVRRLKKFVHDRERRKLELPLVWAELALAIHDLGEKSTEEDVQRLKDLVNREREVMIRYLFPHAEHLSLDDVYARVYSQFQQEQAA